MVNGDLRASHTSGMVWILHRETLSELKHKDHHGKEAGLREFRDHPFQERS